MLTGGILGARNGFLVAVTVFLLSATVGSPLLAGCRAGVALWTGPSTGHLIGWLVGVVVIDLLTARTLAKYPLWEAILVTLFRRSLRRVRVRRDVARHRTGFNSARASVLMYLPGGLFNAIVPPCSSSRCTGHARLIARPAGPSPLAVEAVGSSWCRPEVRRVGGKANPSSAP
jgi:hypothetical protein